MKASQVYVVQVIGGKEEHACELLATLPAGLVQSCYTPSYEAMRKEGDEWVKVKRILFPGYVFVETKQPQKLLKALGKINGFTRLLGVHEDKVTPLFAEEVAWLEAFTDVETHTAVMSEGIIEGDSVYVTKGPLKGHEAQITKIDRHKRCAYVDVSILGRNKQIKVGLEIVRKA